MTLDALIQALRATSLLDRTIAFKLDGESVEVRMMPKAESPAGMTKAEQDDFNERMMYAASKGQG